MTHASTWCRELPNALTASRGLAGPLVIALLVGVGSGRAAFWVFTVAMFTDLVDGWLAARTGANRELGRFLDPLADKVLGASTWVGLLLVGWAPWWLVAPLLVRDVVVAVLWQRFRRHGVHFTASRVGQVATSFEGTALGLLLFHGPGIGVHWPSVGAVVGIVGVCLSLASAVGYYLHRPRGPHRPPRPDQVSR